MDLSAYTKPKEKSRVNSYSLDVSDQNTVDNTFSNLYQITGLNTRFHSAKHSNNQMSHGWGKQPILTMNSTSILLQAKHKNKQTNHGLT